MTKDRENRDERKGEWACGEHLAASNEGGLAQSYHVREHCIQIQVHGHGGRVDYRGQAFARSGRSSHHGELVQKSMTH